MNRFRFLSGIHLQFSLNDFRPNEVKDKDFRSGQGRSEKVQTLIKKDALTYLDSSYLKSKVW